MRNTDEAGKAQSWSKIDFESIRVDDPNLIRYPELIQEYDPYTIIYKTVHKIQ